MADNVPVVYESHTKSPGLKKKHDDGNSSSETIIPKSPRYMRKKRFPTGKVKKYHSQLSVPGKICSNKQKLAAEKCNEAVFKDALNIYNSDESHLSLNIVQNENSSKTAIIQTFNNTLRHSNSLPSISNKNINNLVKYRSCDILPILNIGDTASEIQLSMKTDDSVAKFGQTNKKNVDINSCDDNIKDDVSVDTKSRRSSSSTLRERNNSQDSAFSQISIIEIAEAEEAAKAVAERDAINSTWKPYHSRSKSDASSEINKYEIIENEVFSLPNSFTNKEPVRKKSLFAGQQMTVPTECFFPRPQEGQSITSFLSSNKFTISAELDRENAHFCISDALIAAIEHMKCSRTMRMVEEEDDDESDEEIRKLTQRIRIRRREKQREKVLKSIVLLSDGKTDTTTSQSASPPASSLSSDYEIDSLSSEDEVEDIELSAQTDSNLSSMKENGLSLSMASLYSDADIHRAQLLQKETENKKFQESESVNLSAESVALSLLRKFSEKHLPKASDLQWLVSEQEAPQRLLPLPNSWPVSPDAVEEEYNLGNTRLRGNLEWAPPRPQIIFIIHPSLKRKDIIEKQKFRCAGCGMKIEKNYIKRFRYCDYFGKYFCQCCHSNSLAYIPARILWKWDFSKYYVSKFAWELLDYMFSDPLFNIEDVNSNLYRKVSALDLCRYYRMQLYYLKNFMRTCRQAELLHQLLEEQSRHIIYEPHVYSISDLVQVKNGTLSKQLNLLVNQCVDHVKHCILCQAKGFICEFCQKDDIIFPFQLDKIILCPKCGSCFHKRCCKNVQCPRCKRVQERMKHRAEYKNDEL